MRYQKREKEFSRWSGRCGLLYYESFDDVRKAIDREKQLKGWIRAKKIARITSINPKWQDLAEKWGAPMAFAGEHERPMRECLEAFLPELTGTGSFDCVVLCFANDNFAQDDGILNGDRR